MYSQKQVEMCWYKNDFVRSGQSRIYAGSFLVPSQKVSRLQSSIASVNLNRPVQVRALSSIVGQVISMSLAICPDSKSLLCYN